jgi:hypothetical protein
LTAFVETPLRLKRHATATAFWLGEGIGREAGFSVAAAKNAASGRDDGLTRPGENGRQQQPIRDAGISPLRRQKAPPPVEMTRFLLRGEVLALSETQKRDMGHPPWEHGWHGNSHTYKGANRDWNRICSRHSNWCSDHHPTSPLDSNLTTILGFGYCCGFGVFLGVGR